MAKRLYQVVLLVMLIILQACTGSEMTPEEEIRQFIEAGVTAAEGRNSGDLADLIDDAYQDQRGYDRTQIEKLVKLYFFRHKNIYLFTKINKIDFFTPDKVLVTMHIAMAGNRISDASMLSSLRARIYKFELSLVRNDSWLLREARWKPAAIRDMK